MAEGENEPANLDDFRRRKTRRDEPAYVIGEDSVHFPKEKPEKPIAEVLGFAHLVITKYPESEPFPVGSEDAEKHARQMTGALSYEGASTETLRVILEREMRDAGYYEPPQLLAVARHLVSRLTPKA